MRAKAQTAALRGCGVGGVVALVCNAREWKAFVGRDLPYCIRDMLRSCGEGSRCGEQLSRFFSSLLRPPIRRRHYREFWEERHYREFLESCFCNLCEEGSYREFSVSCFLATRARNATIANFLAPVPATRARNATLANFPGPPLCNLCEECNSREFSGRSPKIPLNAGVTPEKRRKIDAETPFGPQGGYPREA